MVSTVRILTKYMSVRRREFDGPHVRSRGDDNRGLGRQRPIASEFFRGVRFVTINVGLRLTMVDDVGVGVVGGPS